MKFRKKPVVIDAIHWNGMNVEEIRRFTGETRDNYVLAHLPVLIETLEGNMLCGVGDWIIKGVKGEFYPCKSDIFAETYEPA